MRVEKEFVVGVPLERAWRTLSDLEVLASCIPGGELHPVADAFTGSVEFGNDDRIRCEATVRAVDVDEDEHVATILLHGRQLGGPGIGSATVESRCERADSSTRVTLNAEVVSSGHERSAEGLQTVARAVLDKAADLLTERATTAGPPSPPPTPTPPSLEPVSAGAALPVPASPRKGLQRGLAVAGGALVAVVVARRLLGRRRIGPW